MSRLILVRHAEPETDARGRCYGSLDVGLSSAGVEHADTLAIELSAFAPDAVYASPRRRAVDTAAPLAAALGLDIHTDDRLRELDFGELEGRMYEEIAACEPELYRAWMETPTDVRFPGGECYEDLCVRAVAACEEIRLCHERAVVVTHGGVVRSALATWLEIPAGAIFRLDQRYGGVTVVDWLDETPVVRMLNR